MQAINILYKPQIDFIIENIDRSSKIDASGYKNETRYRHCPEILNLLAISGMFFALLLIKLCI